MQPSNTPFASEAKNNTGVRFLFTLVKKILWATIAINVNVCFGFLAENVPEIVRYRKGYIEWSRNLFAFGCDGMKDIPI